MTAKQKYDESLKQIAATLKASTKTEEQSRVLREKVTKKYNETLEEEAKKKSEELANQKAQKEAEQARKASELGIDALVSQAEAIVKSAEKQTEQLKEQEKKILETYKRKEISEEQYNNATKALAKVREDIAEKELKKAEEEAKQAKEKARSELGIDALMESLKTPAEKYADQLKKAQDALNKLLSVTPRQFENNVPLLVGLVVLLRRYQFYPWQYSISTRKSATIEPPTPSDYWRPPVNKNALCQNKK